MQHARKLASYPGMACRRLSEWTGDMVVEVEVNWACFDVQRVDRGRSAGPLVMLTAVQISRVCQIALYCMYPGVHCSSSAPAAILDLPTTNSVDTAGACKFRAVLLPDGINAGDEERRCADSHPPPPSFDSLVCLSLWLARPWLPASTRAPTCPAACKSSDRSRPSFSSASCYWAAPSPATLTPTSTSYHSACSCSPARIRSSTASPVCPRSCRA